MEPPAPDKSFGATLEEMVRMSQALVAEPDAEPGCVANARGGVMLFRFTLAHEKRGLTTEVGCPHRRVRTASSCSQPGLIEL